MPTQRKIEQVEELTEKLARAQMALVADYRGLTVAEMSDLRARLRKLDAELIVAKNTLVLRAAKTTGQDALLEPLLSGPTALTLAYGDLANTAKAIIDFNRGAKQLKVRGGLLGQSPLSEQALDQVSSIPTRQEVLGQIVGGIASPVAGIVGVLNAAITNVMYVLQARIDQLQPGEEASA